ncbi:usherin-like [Anneissia japonica]|uniref:usherin-like n=1 Tax=Anneissia japonica TaxID=1529436 RepID=UPI001425A317|nr:usherin-like [Anneissia japonica]
MAKSLLGNYCECLCNPRLRPRFYPNPGCIFNNWLNLFIFITFILCQQIIVVSTQGAFPQLVNSAEKKSILTIPQIGTCGYNPINGELSRSAYCRSSTLSQSTTSCTQAFCIQACPSRTNFPGSINLLTSVSGNCITLDTSSVRPGSDSSSYAYVFRVDPSGNCYLSPNNIPAVGSNGAVTIAGWFRPESTTDGVLIERRNPSNQIVYALMVSSSTITFDYLTSTGAKFLVVQHGFAVNQWQHFTLQVFGTTASFFINGLEADGTAFDTKTLLGQILDSSNGQTRIGQRISGSNQYVGRMQDFYFYQYTLTNREIEELATGVFPEVHVQSDCRCPDSHPRINPVESRYCIPNGVSDTTSDQMYRLDENAHPLTFANDGDLGSYWVSSFTDDLLVQIDLENGQYQVFYVVLQFYSPQPTALTISRKAEDSLSWSPWQYFADNCQTQFGLQNNGPLATATSVNCIQFSTEAEIPYSKGNITFQLLSPEPVARPGYNDFYNTPELLDFVKASQIQIQMQGHYHTSHARHNYFGIEEITVSARCNCNGHATTCDLSQNPYVCNCLAASYTQGTQCSECLPLYNQKPFRHGNQIEAYNCRPCSCNNHASSCHYNISLDLYPTDHYRGGGGVCDNCQHNTQGRYCDQCTSGHYRVSGRPLNAVDVCTACDCFVNGTIGGSNQCDIVGGQCDCKVFTTGRRCDQCVTGFFNLQGSNVNGCEPCTCNAAGTISGSTTCESTGECTCKANVIGDKCDRCNYGYYGLSASNPNGCNLCTCNTDGSNSVYCDPTNGQCQCSDTVQGQNCDECRDGFYGLSNSGCSPCDCDAAGTEPNTNCDKIIGQCICKVNTQGLRCDQCRTTYYNLQPSNSVGCTSCSCNPSGTIGGSLVCNAQSGQCLCKTYTTGQTCNQCTTNYWGLDASNVDGCQPCACDETGVDAPAVCDQNSGQCSCIVNRYGRRCDQCSGGTYLAPNGGRGCVQCNCHPMSSLSGSVCDAVNGQCQCVDGGSGVTGRRCDSCLPGFFNFSDASGRCSLCSCNPAGSVTTSTCDTNTGQCQCKDLVTGRQCDTCVSGSSNLDVSNPQGCSKAPSQQPSPTWQAISPYSLLLSWRPPDEPNGNILAYNLFRNGGLIYSGIDNNNWQSTQEYIDDSLTPYTQYTYYVQAVNEAGTAQSPSVVARTPDVIPSGFDVLTVSNIGPRTAFFSWYKPTVISAPLDQYVLTSVSPSRPTPPTTHYSGSATSFQANDLVPFTNYTFRLTVCSSDGCGQGVGITVYTPQAPPEGLAPPTLTALSATEVYVEWNHPTEANGIITHYELFIRGAPDANGVIDPPESRIFYPAGWYNPRPTVTPGEDPVSEPTTNFTQENLEPFTEYEFRVTAMNQAGTGQSEWAFVRTLEADPLSMPSPVAVGISSTQLNVSWTEPSTDQARGVIIQYKLYQFLISFDPFAPPESTQLIYAGPGYVTFYIVSNLEPYSSHEFAVEACNSKGCVRSDRGKGNTLPDAPENQEAPLADGYNITTIQASWLPPVVQNGPAPSYYLQRMPASLNSPPPVVEMGSRFPGGGYYRFSGSLIPTSSYTGIELEFRIRRPPPSSRAVSALLLFAVSSGEQEEYIVIQLRDGRPWFLFDPQGGAVGVTTTNDGGKTYDDDNWHHLKVTRDGTRGYITVDQVYTGSALSSTASSIIGITDSVYIGGLPADFFMIRTDTGNTEVIRTSFVGCMKNVQIERQHIPTEVWQVVDWSDAVDSYQVVPTWQGCPIDLDTGVHFLGGGYAAIPAALLSSGTNFIIQFEFRTLMDSAMLIFSHGTNGAYLILQLVSQDMQLQVFGGAGVSTLLSATSTTLCSGQWNTVTISRAGNSLSLTIGGGTASTRDIGSGELSLTSDIFIGGLPLGSDSFQVATGAGLNIQPGLGGCFQNMAINSVIVDLETQATDILNVNLDGCPSITSTSTTCTMPAIINVYSGQTRVAYDTGLDSYTEYMYRVVSTNEAGSTTSEWTRARTREGAPVGVLPPLDPESVTGYIIRVRWIRPTGNNGVLIQFILTAYNQDQPELLNVIAYFNDTSPEEYIGNITGVVPYTNYQVTLTACTEGGCTESLPVSIATKEEAPEGVSPPRALTSTGNSITVGWDEPEKPNGLVRRYQLFMNNIGLYQGTVRSFTVHGLSIYTAYDFYVTACTNVGCGQSPEVTLTTAQLPPSDVTPPTLYVRGARLIEAQWIPPSQPNGVLERYVLFLSTQSFFLGEEIYNSTALFLDFIITDLTPGTTYYVTLVACNDGGCTNSAPSVAVTHESTPEGVPAPTVTALSPYGLQVEWTEPDQPNGFITSYALYQNNIVIQNGTAMFRVISNLLPYSLHILRVEACTVKGCSIGPETRARTQESAPVGSISLAVGVVTSRSVSAQWTAPAQPNGVMIYQVLFTGLFYLSPETGNYNTFTTTRPLYNGTDSETPVLIDGLIPYTTYNIQVQGMNTKGSLTSNTEPATMPAGSPDGVFPPVVSAIDATSIQAVWTAPGRNNAPGQPTYQLLFRPTQQPGLQEELFASATSVDSFTKYSLTPYTEYDFKLIASNGFGQTESDWTSTFTKEATPGPIDPPMATVIDGTTLQVTWELADQPNGIITHTRIHQNNQYRDMVDGTITEYLATDLTAFTDYVFKIDMCNSAGCTSSPNSITYTTPAAAPSGQLPPTLLSETPTSIVIMWEEPSNPNGVLTSYILERRHQGFAAITTVVSVDRDGPFTYVDQSAAISPFTTYEYRVMVSNVAGSTTSQWSVVTTRAAPPGGVAAPLLTVTGPETILVSWSPPVQSNGDIISYTIKMPNPRVPVLYVNVTSYEVANLVPYTEYSVTIEACTVGGCSESNPTRARTDPTFPQGQDPPTTTPITQNYISIIWDPPSRPNGPNIRYELARMKIREPLATGTVTGIGFWELITSTTDTAFQNTGLPTFSTYQYRVTVYNDFGSMISDPSPEVTTLAGVPQTGGTIVAQAIDHISVLVNWTTPSLQQLQGDVVENYVVFNTASSVEQSRSFPPGIDGAVIGGLQPNSYYEFRIVIYNGAYNVSSDPATAETLDGAPEGFNVPTIHVISSTSLRVIWIEPTTPNGDIQSYNVYLDNQNVATLPSTTMSHVLFDLEPYTVYSIQVEVCTVYDCLLSPAAQTTTTEALPMGLAPPNLRVLGDETIDINWAAPSQPNGIITKYALFRRALRPCDTGEEVAEKTCQYIECGVSESICGSQCYSGNKVCCNGELYDFQIGFECCDSNYLAARTNPTDVCCGGQFRTAQSNYQCCNGQYVAVLPGQICCADPDEDRIEIGSGDACCGGIPYAANGPQICCGGAFFDSQRGLCCDATYVSFEGTFYDGFNAHCCGSSIISVNQVCCGSGNSVRTYTLDPSKVCCNNVYENPDKMLCCTNSEGQQKAHVYANSNEKLSANDQCCNLETIPNTHSCCNGIGYNQATHICADRSTTARGNCASGTICPVSQAFSAYCNRCDFDTNLKVCGTVDEQFLDAIILPIPGAVCPSTLDTIYEGGPNTYTFLDQELSPYTTYQYSIAVYNSAGSFTSDYGNATTEEAIPSGVQPPSATILLGILDTIVLNWNEPLYPNGIITSYIIRRDGIEIYRGIGNSFSDRNGIQPYQHYNYILSACTRVGCADSISVVAATLQAKPEGVSNPIVTPVSDTSMRVTWVEPTSPNGVLQDYKIYLTGVELPIYVTAPNRFEYMHRDLTPFTRYEYTLEACTEAGCTASNPVAGMTLEGVPAGLSPPIHVVISSSILELYWSEPEFPNGDISTYRLYRQNQLIYVGNGSVYMYINSGLSPNTRYAYILQAATSAGSVNSSEYIVQTPQSTPEGIPAPTLSVVSATQIRATWTAPVYPNGNIAAYGVVVMSGSPQQFTRFSGLTQSFLLTGLEPYTQYNVRVQVCNNGGCGHGPKAYARTSEASPQEQDPPVLKATGPSVIEVSWQPPVKPNGIITSYEVYRRLYGSSQEVLSYVGPALFFTNAAPELVAFTLYEYKVRARNSLGYIDSNWAAVRTLEAAPEGVPEPLGLEAVSPYGVRVQWNEPTTPNGVITTYRIEYRQVSIDPTLTNPVESAATVAGIIREATFYGLVPYTSYQVRIVAINSAGEGSGSWGDVTTAEGVPANIQPFVVQTSSDGLSLILRWNEPGQVNGKILSYNIYQDIYLTEAIYTGLQREFVFRRLMPYTEYTLILEACTGAGCGRGQPQTVVTAAVLPENQGAPTIEFVNATQVTLSWVPPISANGPITRYDILRRSSSTSQRRKRDTDDSTFTQTNIVYVEYNTDYDYYTFTDSQLRPYTVYEYKIVTFNTIGSTDSGWVSVQTEQAAPTSVDPPSVNFILDNPTTLIVQWTEPDEPNGVIQVYVLERNGTSPFTFPADFPNTFNDTELEAYTVYYYTIKACTACCCTTSDKTFIRTLEAAPVFVDPPVPVAISSSAIQVSWNVPSLRYGEIIRYELKVDGQEQYRGLDLQTVINSLIPFKEYTFTVVACTSGGCTESVPSYARPFGAPPQQMNSPSLKVLSATAVEASWTDPLYPNGEISNYELRRDGRLIYSGLSQLFSDFGDGGRGLTPGQEYSYVVAAFNKNGTAVSDPATITTSSSSPAGLSPPSLTALSSTSISATWVPPLYPNGDILNYTLYLDGSPTFSGVQFSHVVRNLFYFTLYEFRIEACTESGCALSERATTRTLEHPPSSQLAPSLTPLADSLGIASGISVEWGPPQQPNGIILYYQLQRRQVFRISGGRGETFLLQNGTSLSYIDEDPTLEPNMEYEYRVTSFNTAGQATSSWATVRMLEAPPEGLEPPQFSLITSTSVLVNIQEPAKPNGIITSYAIMRNSTELSRTTASSYSDEGLQPFTYYAYSVKACTSRGCTTSEPGYVQTLQSVPIGLASPIIVQEGVDFIEVSWQGPEETNGIIEKYELYSRPACPLTSQPFPQRCTEVSFSKAYQGLSTNFTLRNLKPYTSYEFQASAYNSEGRAESPAALGTTLPDVPLLISEPNIYTNGSALVIAWTNSFDLNSKLIEYVLTENGDKVYSGIASSVERPLTGKRYEFLVKCRTTSGEASSLPTIYDGTNLNGKSTGNSSEDWYSSVWFLSLVVLFIVILLFVGIAVCLSRMGTRKPYERERQPLPPRQKRGMLIPSLNNCNYAHSESIMDPIPQNISRSVSQRSLTNASLKGYNNPAFGGMTPQLPRSRRGSQILDEKHSFKFDDEDDGVWDNQVADSGLYDDDNMTHVSQPYSYTKEQTMFTDTHL